MTTAVTKTPAQGWTAALLLALALAACQPGAAPPAAPNAAAPAAAVAAPPPSPAPPATIDKQQLIGRFGVDGSARRTVQFMPNGRYLMLGGVVWERVESTWSLEAEGTRLRLHHDHRDSEDLLFAVRSPDVLVMLNADGTPVAGVEATLERLPQ